MANSLNKDVTAHDELPPPDAYCLQMQLFYIFGALSVKYQKKKTKPTSILFVVVILIL